MEAPPHNLRDLKDLLLMPWCLIPQDTLRGLVETMPRGIRAVLAANLSDLHDIRLVLLMFWLICSILIFYLVFLAGGGQTPPFLWESTVVRMPEKRSVTKTEPLVIHLI